MDVLEDLHNGLAPTIRATLTKNYEERIWQIKYSLLGHA
ncbi:unnamed protein product [Strongylus vulgaris]|uniref:Uncharacterized protein n=1 Tax=Strongylus vulgaris TaxID=40348 RepID=A0A3P7JXW8_STRVU|nr:unnamed protein product [Strongylus vulgaris]